MGIAYAHSRNGLGLRHDLAAHLRSVAELAALFAPGEDASRVARALGLWHDVGKFHPAFQRYLLDCEENKSVRGHGPDHKGAGALLAWQHHWLCGLLIQAHHGGLRSPVEFLSWFKERESDSAARAALVLARAAMPDLGAVEPIALPPDVEQRPAVADLFARMLLSALVDADYLDTERHFSRDRIMTRQTDIGMASLWERFEGFHRARFGGPPQGAVATARRQVYDACLAAAEGPPGLYRLTVPTGGGKTLSALAFALRHAARHGLRRVIAAVPFISITEQTADSYRAALEVEGSSSVVLEHHSGTTGLGDEGFEPGEVWARLAAENWDAPVVVTTTVQLFESLLANATSRVRKLHRLAASVVIIDEAQALPSHLLATALDVLRQLCVRYGATVVIATATQPAFSAIPTFAGLDARDIIPRPEPLFATLQRVTYDWQIETQLSWDEAARPLRAEAQGLAVVNTKRDAVRLLDALGDPDALHLSTLLCGAHRRRVIVEVSRRLSSGERCRLVSTQVIEAGVDLDFPFVMRALGPLDAVIQAAGRCNREGRLHRGRVIIFRPATGGMPGGAYRTAAGITASLIEGGRAFDPNDPGLPTRYFQRLFETIDVDRECIEDVRGRLDFPEVARRFRMIDEDTASVVVSYGSLEERRGVKTLMERLRSRNDAGRLLVRQLQPYMVSLRRRLAERYEREGLITPLIPGIGEWLGQYHPVRGLIGEDLDSDALVV